MRKFTGLVAVASAAVLALSACGDDGDDTTTPEAPSSDIKVGLAYDIGGRGDKSFNDSAATGLDQAIEEFGITSTELEAGENETDAQKEERLRQLADEGHNPIIAVGFAYAAALGAVAPEYPDVSFAIIDDSTLEDVPNVASLTFAEEEGSFLVGAIAAQASETNHIGFVGGVQTPLIEKFEAGFVAGAEAVTPDIVVDITYLTQIPDFTGFNDPAKGKTAAQGMFDGGADVVYHAAGGSGGGVFEAASESEGLAIGVDSDQYLGAEAAVQPVILTSMLKRVDVAVYDAIQAFVDGSPLTGNTIYDLEKEGVGFSESNSAVEPFVATAEEYQAQIISGEITVPTEPSA